MCGIAGILRLDGDAVDPTQLDRLTDALAHRGPDGRGVFSEGSVGLGHRRLKILDLSDAAVQPMISEDRNFVLVFNGEIYNFKELREELEARGHRFRSTGDTEVLLKMYQQDGERCIEKLRGMFAFAVFDRKKNIVFLARDRVGKKPIKYFHSGSVFAFASELKALTTLPECPTGVDEEAVHHFLTMMYVLHPATGRRGIKKLPPGTMLTIDLASGKISEPRQYWQLQYEPKVSHSVGEWQQRIGDVFDESVRLRMIADVPVGAFLSGGVDSAAVVAAMAKHSKHPIKTFSIGSDAETHNELPYAKITAEAFGTDHHPITLTPDIVHLLPELVRTYEEPFADPSTIPSYLIARETKKHVTVALNGDGGDENFCGYVRYPILRFSLLWEKFPRLFHAPVLATAKLFHRMAKSTFSERCVKFEESMQSPWEERYLFYLSFFSEEEKRRLYVDSFAKDFLPTGSFYASRLSGARQRAKDRIEQAMSMDLDSYLADDLIPKVDLGTMTHGLEARSPLLDHELLELTARMPLALKLRGMNRKWIFRRMLRGTVPDHILQKKKTGFRLPLNSWFRGDLKSFVFGRLLDPSSTLRRIMNPDALEEFLDDYVHSSVDRSDHVWALLWLEEWLRQYA